MAILRDVLIPLGNYPTGVHQVPQRNVPDTTTKIYFEFARCTSVDPTIWPNAATRVQYKQWVSFNGGSTWIEAGGFGSFGGIFVGRDGLERPISTFIMLVPPGTSRLWRAEVEIIAGPLRTSGALELRD